MMPEPVKDFARKVEEYTRGLVTGGTLFEELGFYYVGPVDGHDVNALVEVLENVRDADIGPMLVHVVTQKGKGYGPAESSADKYHGVVKFDVVSGKQDKGPGGGPPSYQNVFGETLAKLAETDPKIVAITAAMPSGTGRRQVRQGASRSRVRRRHRRAAWRDLRRGARRAGHAAVRAPSIRPSSSAPTTRSSTTSRSRICRCASPWTAPGWSAPTARPTPAASTSLTSAPCPISSSWPPSDEVELAHMVKTMAEHDSGPIAVRYPRGEGRGLPLPEVPQALEIGKGRIVREGKTVAILSLGTRLAEAEKAADELEARGLSTTVADLRFAKPLDRDLIRRLLATHEVAVTIEEASIGGLRRACADAGQRRGADRRRPQAPHHAPARPLPGPGQARQAI